MAVACIYSSSNTRFAPLAVLLALVAPPATAEMAAPRYKADVPQSITTPDRVETRLLGQLDFTDGMPSAETARKTQDFMVVARAAEAFLSGMPAASLYAFTAGLRQAGRREGLCCPRASDRAGRTDHGCLDHSRIASLGCRGRTRGFRLSSNYP
jgi:hypothetical protein